MTEAVPDTAPDLNTALDAAWPALKKTRGKTYLYVGLAIAIFVAIFSIFLSLGSEAVPFVAIFLSILTLMAFAAGAAYLGSAAYEAIMPAVVQASGLDHAEEGLESTTRLKNAGFLPVQNTTETEDAFRGQIGEIAFCKVEVDIADKRTYRDSDGKTRTRTTTYFDGFVFLLDNLPARTRTLIITRKGRGAKWLHESIQRTGYNENAITEQESPAGNDFRVYALRTDGALHPDSQAFLDRVFEIESRLPKGQSIFSALQAKEATYLAISTKRNLYRFGGLLVTKERLRLQIARALDDLQAMLATLALLIPKDRQS